MSRHWAREAELRLVSRSDDLGEFGERDRNATTRAGFDTEFVVATAKVLHERVTTHDDACGAIGLQSPHRPQPRLQPAMVGLDPVVFTYCAVL